MPAALVVPSGLVWGKVRLVGLSRDRVCGCPKGRDRRRESVAEGPPRVGGQRHFFDLPIPLFEVSFVEGFVNIQIFRTWQAVWLLLNEIPEELPVPLFAE